MLPIGREESYDSLRPYLPEDAKSVLEKELPRIKKQIDGEIEDFAKSFGEYINSEVTALSAEIEKVAKESNAKLDSILTELRKSATPSAADLVKNAEALKTEVETYKRKWEEMGKTTRKTILTAAKAVGVPVPLNLE